MKKAIVFDMDGTIVDLYNVKGWLNYLQNESVYPYENAKPLLNMIIFRRLLNRLKAKGWTIKICSWTAKDCGDRYHESIKEAKIKWCEKYDLPIDEYVFQKYGSSKNLSIKNKSVYGVLFDDNEEIRKSWDNAIVFDETDIVNKLEFLEKFF